MCQRLVSFRLYDASFQQDFQLIWFADIIALHGIVGQWMSTSQLFQFHHTMRELEPLDIFTIVNRVRQQLDFIHAIFTRCEFNGKVGWIMELWTRKIAWLQKWHEFWRVSLIQAVAKRQNVNLCCFRGIESCLNYKSYGLSWVVC